jgi:hypothetical protein
MAGTPIPNTIPTRQIRQAVIWMPAVKVPSASNVNRRKRSRIGIDHAADIGYEYEVHRRKRRAPMQRTIARSRCRTRLSSIEAIIPRYQRVCLYAPTAASTCPFP